MEINDAKSKDSVRSGYEAEEDRNYRKSVREGCRAEGISDHTYYKWRKEYGGLSVDQAKELKKLKEENLRLKKAVADLTLDKLILNEALSGKY